MARMKTQNQYAVKRGTRFDKTLGGWLYNRIIRAAIGRYGEFDDENSHEAPPEYVAIMWSMEAIEKFCRVVVYTDRSNGQQSLKTMDGLDFSIPGHDANDQSLLDSFLKWLKVDETVTDALDKEIREINAPPVDRALLPKEQLTEVERADPN